MNNFSFKNFFLMLIISLIFALSLSLFVSNRLARTLSNDLRDREMTLLLDALMSGPLAIARLNSSAFSQEAVDRLMSSPSLKNGSVNEVSILGGFQKNYKYANWKSPNKLISDCLGSVQREFHYPESLNSFFIIINYDKCKVLNEEKQIYKISLLGIFIVFSIVSIVLILSFLPILQSLKNSFRYLKTMNPDSDLKMIKFLPLRSLTELALSSLRLEKEASLVHLSRQVAHDIRSPLSALEIAINEIESVPTDYRHIINNSVKRINDIANNLLNYNYEKKLLLNKEFYEESLFFILESLIAEKKMQYQNLTKVSIELNYKANHLLFVRVNKADFYRVLSNLINNSIEAVCDSGSIIVNVDEHQNNQVLISIEDDGKGIPSSILAKVGKNGFSYGKSEQLGSAGSGLGVFHAIHTIESFGGELEIESTESIGTKVKIILKVASVPDWVADVLDISNKEKIYVLEKDESLQQIWKEKLGNKVESYFNESDFLDKVSFNSHEDVIYLIENGTHFNNSGLDLIESLGISKSSYLVVDSFEDKEIIERCLKLGVRIIAKSLIQWIDINLSNTEVKMPFEYVYIEDDEILRMVWENRARKNNVRLLTLENSRKFDDYINQIDIKTQIYLDSFLGEDEIRGEAFAEILHEKGYINLYMTSGYDKEVFAHFAWLKVSGKKCPF